MESATAAQALRDAALDRISAMAGLPERAAAGVPATHPAGRHFCVMQPAPDRVRFLNTATMDLLQRFSATAP